MAFITGMLCLVLLLVVLLAIVLTMIVSHRQRNTTPTFDWAGIDELTVTSENLQNGIWDDSIANTERGRNLSPQLSWEKAENAQAYVIYMIDPDGNNWMHLISGILTKEELAQDLLNYVLEVASGRKVKSEAAGFHDMAIFKQGVTL